MTGKRALMANFESKAPMSSLMVVTCELFPGTEFVSPAATSKEVKK